MKDVTRWIEIEQGTVVANGYKREQLITKIVNDALECNKSIREKDNIEKIKLEIADATIMIKQLKIIFCIADEEIEEIIDMKLNRQMERMEKED